MIAASLFFIPTLTALVRRQQALAELSADESAALGGTGTRPALARAMLAFVEPGRTDDLVGVDPDRVDHLLGQSPGWRFPAALCVGTAAVLVLMWRHCSRGFVSRLIVVVLAQFSGLM